jgi:TetR/AcrR family transcriptional repressor of nem operon
MRYSETHKQETHAKLVKIAGRALREKGPERFGVAELMQAAGLTHGGFYAHFKSKDALLAEALDDIFADAKIAIGQLTAGLPPRHALATFVDFYVSVAHRDNIVRGCPVVALNSDLPRQSRQFRASFNRGMKLFVATLAGWIRGAGVPGDSEALAASIISAMAGAVAIARTVSDKGLSDELLASARDSIKTRLGVDDAALSNERVH